MRRAMIDVGTNSIKLLVAEVAGHQVSPVLEQSCQTRLGQGFFQTRKLQPGPIARTASAVAEFVAQARQNGARSLRIIATSAAREAVNSAELIQAIEQAGGLSVEIISGEQEADWAYQGVCTDPELERERLLLLDVGGGSTEFIVGHAGHKDFRQSYQLGTVRLLEQLRPGDAPSPADLIACRQLLQGFLTEKVLPDLAPVLKPAAGQEPSVPAQLVGTGGTASILGCMEAQLDHFDRERLESTCLSLERLRWHVERLWALPLEERKKTVGLPKNRADVILTGSAIYQAVMEQFGFILLRISTRGLRFAAVLDGCS